MKRRKRNRIKLFIVLGLVGIVACSAWILNNRSVDRQEAPETAYQDPMAEDAFEDIYEEEDAADEANSEEEDPQAQTQQQTQPQASSNPSPDRHAVTSVDSSGNLFNALDTASEEDDMYVELELTIADDGVLHASGGGESLALTDVFDRYGSSVGYVLELEDSDGADMLGKAVSQYELGDSVIVESYDAGVLEAMEGDYPDITKMFLCRDPDDRSRGLDMDYADIICMPRKYLNQFGVSTVHSAGKKFGIRSIETRQHINDAIGLGVDIYITGNTEAAIELEKQYRGQ